MENNPLFLKSSVFGGFKKKEVLSYIFELNESTQEAQQKFAEQIEELSRSRDDALKSLEELQSRLDELQAEADDAELKLEAETEKNLNASETIERLTSELKKRDGDIAQKENEISRFAAMNTELADKNRALEEKRSQVELAASQIAGILGQARDDAEQVVAEAREEAAATILEAQSKADALAAHAKSLAERHTQDANRQTEAIYSQFNEFHAELDKLRQAVLDAASEMTDKADSIGDAFAKAMEAIPERLSPPESLPENTEPKISLEYEFEDERQTPASSPALRNTAISGFTGEILGRYGVRKDDSGFFRLAIEK